MHVPDADATDGREGIERLRRDGGQAVSLQVAGSRVGGSDGTVGDGKRQLAAAEVHVHRTLMGERLLQHDERWEEAAVIHELHAA